jgi:UDP-N-acetylglucosamine 2-epimerase (non-hydrolysing)
MNKILVVISTRTEAIKMAPLVRRLQSVPTLQTTVCLAAQSPQSLGQELAIFGAQVDEDISRAQGADGINENRVLWIDQMIEKHQPDCVLVHGDTTMALASFHRRIPVDIAGVGLRMYELRHSAAGETARQTADLIATHYFVSSEVSRGNLLKEGVAAEHIFLTDSTAADALLMVVERIRDDAALRADLKAAFPFLDPNKRLILVAGHRRQKHDGGLESVCRALRRLAMRPDVQVVYPVPTDPRVRSVVDEVFDDHPDTVQIEQQDYLHWIYLMQSASLIITDSDDIQEEARLLGKPLLVTCDAGEHQEAVDTGAIKLVGTDAERIVLECDRFLDDPSYCRTSSQRAPYSDGQASQRIVEAMLR